MSCFCVRQETGSCFEIHNAKTDDPEQEVVRNAPSYEPDCMEIDIILK